VAFIPGLTGRLYNQFAMTIVFSFLFSAFNSLTFTPAIARLFLRPKVHGVPARVFPTWAYAIAGYVLGWWIASRLFAPHVGLIPFFDFAAWRFIRPPLSDMVPVGIGSIAGAGLMPLVSPLIEGLLKGFFALFNRGMRWLENSYDAFLDFTAHHWWTIV